MEGRFDAAVKGIVVCGDRMLLLRRSPHAHYKPSTWEFAGGKVEFGETLEQALAREVREEAGIAVAVHEVLYVTSFIPRENRQVILATYRCTSADDAVRLSHEHDACQWARLEALGDILDPDIWGDMQRYGADTRLAGLLDAHP